MEVDQNFQALEDYLCRQNLQFEVELRSGQITTAVNQYLERLDGEISALIEN